MRWWRSLDKDGKDKERAKDEGSSTATGSRWPRFKWITKRRWSLEVKMR
jgi:hypothetical protein